MASSRKTLAELKAELGRVNWLARRGPQRVAPPDEDAGFWCEITGGPSTGTTTPYYSAQEMQGGSSVAFSDPAATWDGTSIINTALSVAGVQDGMLASINNGAYFALVTHSNTGEIDLQGTGLGTKPAAGTYPVTVGQQYLVPKLGGIIADATGAAGWPAYEVNGNLNVPVGAIVRLRFQGAGPYWQFSYSAAPNSPGTAPTIQRRTLSADATVTLTGATVNRLQITVSVGHNVNILGIVGATPDRPLTITCMEASAANATLTLPSGLFATPFAPTPLDVILQPGQSAEVYYDDGAAAWQVAEGRTSTAIAFSTSSIPAGVGTTPGQGFAHLYREVGGGLVDTGYQVTVRNNFGAILPGAPLSLEREETSGEWYVANPPGGGTSTVYTTNIYNITTVNNNSFVYNQYNNTLYWYYNSVYIVISTTYLIGVCAYGGLDGDFSAPGSYGSPTATAGITASYLSPDGYTYCINDQTDCCHTTDPVACARCSHYTMPTTLYLELNSDGAHTGVGPPPGCDCLDYTLIALTYSPANGYWFATGGTLGTCSLDALSIFFYCTGNGWALEIQDTVTGATWYAANLEQSCCQFLWSAPITLYPYCAGPVTAIVYSTSMNCGGSGSSGSGNSGSSGSGGGGVTGCSICTGGAARQFTFPVSGVANGTCTDCAAANVTRRVGYEGGCSWSTGGVAAPDGGSGPIAFCNSGLAVTDAWLLDIGVNTPGVVTLSYYINLHLQAVYEANIGTWDCKSPLTLTGVVGGTPTYCTNYPATVTITPV